ncbi:MAG: RNA methyltransferase [Crocinitomicaceae bacterium]|nr:RNA methyltransferase [Crocinitomicaceae bacterium]
MQALSKNKIKWIRSLRLKKNRDAEDVFVVEGKKMVEEILSNFPESILLACSTESIHSNIEVFNIESSILKEISNLKTPPTMIAVVKKPSFPSIQGNFILALDGIQDPGNLGTIIRTADWFGVDKIVCSNETVDCFNSKVIQSSMGSLFRIPVEYLDLSNFLNKSTLPIYGALLDGENVYDQDIQSECILVIGNEGKGITEQVKPFIKNPVFIPRIGGAESLNASIATGILLAIMTK